MALQGNKDTNSALTEHSILIINPNTSAHMTEALKPMVEKLRYTDVRFDYFTAPDTPTLGPEGNEIQGIPSINNGDESALSALYCFPHLKPILDDYDAFLVACYSAHPLVAMLKAEIESRAEYPNYAEDNSQRRRRKHVTGIFEASVATCLALTRNFSLLPNAGLERSVSATSFGIVTTGSMWKDELNKAVTKLLLGNQVADDGSAGQLEVFAGVATTGLTAVELHTTPEPDVKKRIIDATARLINGTDNSVAAICLGCAGMSGMDAAVREGCIRALGTVAGEKVLIVDGVMSGIGMLVNACKAGL